MAPPTSGFRGRQGQPRSEFRARDMVLVKRYLPAECQSVRVVFEHIGLKPTYLPHARSYYPLFSHFGDIFKISFLRRHHQTPTAQAGIVVVFEPAPADPFWLKDVITALRPGQGETVIPVRFRARFLSSYPRAPSPPPGPTTGLSPGLALASISSSAPVTRSTTPTMPTPPTATTSESGQAGITVRNSYSADFSSMHFALSTRPLTMASKLVLPASGGPMKMTVEIGHRRRLDIEFSIRDGTTYPKTAGQPTRKPYLRFKFDVDIAMLDMVFYEPGKAVVLSLAGPPRFWERAETPSPPPGRTETSWSSCDLWSRMTYLPLADDGRARVDSGPVRLFEKGAVGVRLGEWTTYRFELDAGQTGPMERLLDVLAAHNITINRTDRFMVVPSTEPVVFNSLDLSAGDEGGPAELDIAQHGSVLPFAVRYQLEACLAARTVERHNLTAEFVSRLAAMAEFQAQDVLEKAFYSGRSFVDPLEILASFTPRARPARLPRYCSLSRTVIVTPTTMRLLPASAEISNRVIRKYQHLSDNFIRIRFTDEHNRGPLFYDIEIGRQIYERVGRALREGIAIGHYRFDFLAWGSSQLREHGAYAFRAAGGTTAGSIRAWMGDFSAIRNVAKYASRLSLAFSTTRPFSGFTVTNTEIADFEQDGHVFSDGVGKMSVFLAQMVGRALGLPDPLNDPPSVIQFRYGGHKGVLAIDPTLAQYSQICTRPSQNKFRFTETPTVEVTRTSSFSVAQLNRQLIAVLSCLGISDDVFVDKLRVMVAKLSRSMVDPEVAVEFLRRNVDHNHTTVLLANLVEDGFLESEEPVLVGSLQLWRTWLLKTLKDKAHILIEDGAFVLGCVDETGSLQGHYEQKLAGPFDSPADRIASLPQIFIQVGIPTRPGVKADYHVVTGPCIIARNPALHPGDIRVVNAIDVPSLHHLKNVVVLPQAGDRPISTMCAGGDLDGDDYIVIWDQDLLFDCWNVPAMSYASAAAPTLDRPVEVDDMVSFFSHYIQNDTLARIALAHLGHSDGQPDGAGSPICLRLAQLHSDAVDFAKTGVVADFKRQDQPTRWPHFMERKTASYRSSNILGRLYDMVESVTYQPSQPASFCRQIGPLWQAAADTAAWARLCGQAAAMKERYDTDLRRLIAQHSVQSELEAWTVFSLTHTTGKGSYKFAEALGRAIDNIKLYYRRAVCEDAGVTADRPDYHKLGAYIAAMYEVTADEARKAAEAGAEAGSGLAPPSPLSRPFITFPWLFPTELGTMATFGRAPSVQTAVKAALSQHDHSSATLVEEHSRLVSTLNNLATRTRVLSKPVRKIVPPSFAWANAAPPVVAGEEDKENGGKVEPGTADAADAPPVEIKTVEAEPRPLNGITGKSEDPSAIANPTKDETDGDDGPASVPAGVWMFPGADDDDDLFDASSFAVGTTIDDIYSQLGQH